MDDSGAMMNADSVVNSEEPKKSIVFITETVVPATATGYHSFTCENDRVMNPAEIPNTKQTANQNQ